jgi:AcrR family transcriptional regulator
MCIVSGMPSTPVRRNRADRARATRAHLIATTIDLVRTRSYGQATLFEVAKAAGVTPGALQHHFGSRAMLMLEVLQAILEADDARGVPWPDASQALPERSAALVQALWARLYEPPRFLAAWGVYFGAAGDADLQPRVAEMRLRLAGALHQRFADALPEAAGHAGFDGFVDLVLSALRGLGVARLFGPDSASEAAQLGQLAGVITTWCAMRTTTPAAASRRRPRKETP